MRRRRPKKRALESPEYGQGLEMKKLEMKKLEMKKTREKEEEEEGTPVWSSSQLGPTLPPVKHW